LQQIELLLYFWHTLIACTLYYSFIARKKCISAENEAINFATLCIHIYIYIYIVLELRRTFWSVLCCQVDTRDLRIRVMPTDDVRNQWANRRQCRLSSTNRTRVPSHTWPWYKSEGRVARDSNSTCGIERERAFVLRQFSSHLARTYGQREAFKQKVRPLYLSVQVLLFSNYCSWPKKFIYLIYLRKQEH